MTRGAIEWRLRLGRLHRLHRGVYAVGHLALTRRSRWLAAVLACGDRAALSHHAAGAHRGLRPSSRTITQVTTANRGRHGSRAIRVHRVRRLEPADVTVHDGIPVTTIARTLLDLAEVLQPHQLENAFEQAERLQLLDLEALEETCRRNPGRRGLRPLTRLLEQARPAPDTRSGLERRFLRLCARFGIDPPLVNTAVEGFDVDAFWPAHRLVVEVDSRGFHSTRAAFERDRVRDAHLQVAGYRVVRITERRMQEEPDVVAQTLRALMLPAPAAPATPRTAIPVGPA